MGMQKQPSKTEIARNQSLPGGRPDRLVLTLLGVALVLGALPVLVVGLTLSGSTPVPLPWVTAVSSSFLGAAVLSAAFLSFGRFSVLRDPASFWIGMGLASFGIANGFYILTWPGLLPNGQALVSNFANTPAWVSVVGPGLFGLLLFAAPVARWPGANTLSGSRWIGIAVIGLVLVTLALTTLVYLEDSLPLLIQADGSFTPLLLALNALLVLLFSIGALLSIRYYRHTGDTLPAYIAFVQAAFALGTSLTFIGGKRYDAAWYAARFVMVGPYFAVLWGLVWDYVEILRRERTRTEELQERSAEREDLLRREREAHLAAEEARAAAAAAVRVRDQFIAVASHELKTPLTSIRGYAELVVQRATQLGLDESLLHMLETISAQSVRLEKMIYGLLDISRIERGQLSLERAPLDLRALLSRIIEDVRPTLHRHTLTFSGEGAQLMVFGDASRLEQVLQNLIQNAIKYSPLGGPVSIDLQRMDNSALVCVSDKGIGIPTADLPQIFTRFHRAGNADVYHISGLGVGLYVVHEIVRLHGGEITVESQEGEGSTFRVTLPMAIDTSS